MITINDFEAFCEADPAWVRELARSKSIGMVQAYAEAHESMSRAPARAPASRPSDPRQPAGESSYRRAA